MGLLSAVEIEARKTEIFRDDTFASRCLRPAAYDLRVEVDGAAEDSTTGTVTNDILILEKGQRAVLKTYEVIAMPWNLAGNLGVKHRKAILGLFITPGLFVDPGFGWAEGVGENAPPVPRGDRLRFLVTNVGSDQIVIRLGEAGDHVIGLQFFGVSEPGEKTVRSSVPLDDVKGLAFFEDLIAVESKVEKASAKIDRTETATDRVVVFGVFLVSATIFGALIAYLLATLSSEGVAGEIVSAVNRLEDPTPWAIVLIVSIAVLAVACVAGMALLVCRLFREMWKRKDEDD